MSSVFTSASTPVQLARSESCEEIDAHSSSCAIQRPVLDSVLSTLRAHTTTATDHCIAPRTGVSRLKPAPQGTAFNKPRPHARNVQALRGRPIAFSIATKCAEVAAFSSAVALQTALMGMPPVSVAKEALGQPFKAAVLAALESYAAPSNRALN
jgi:hypothetical protein